MKVFKMFCTGANEHEQSSKQDLCVEHPVSTLRSLFLDWMRVMTVDFSVKLRGISKRSEIGCRPCNVTHRAQSIICPEAAVDQSS